MILAVTAHGQWWEILAALATPATIVCGYIARKVGQLGEHLEHQDRRQTEHAERLARVEGAVGLNPRSLPPAQ